MRRREFIGLIGGTVATWPLAASTQQLEKLPTIGFLGSGTPAGQGEWLTAFLQKLRELGWIEGRNIMIEYRWAEGSSDRAAELAAEFVRIKVDVIVTYANPIVLAAKQSTSTIPIVFAVAADPLGTGLVASLARPGGNLTGLSVEATDLGGKRLQLLRELVPGLRRLAIMSILTIPLQFWRCARFSLRHGHWTLKLRHSISGKRRILRLPSRSLTVTQMHFTSALTQSYSASGFAFSPRP